MSGRPKLGQPVSALKIASAQDVKFANNTRQRLGDVANAIQTVGSDAMATYGANTGQWVEKVNPSLGKEVTGYWEGQMSPAYKDMRDNSRSYRFVTDAIDPINALGTGAGAAGVVGRVGKVADGIDLVNNVRTLVPNTEGEVLQDLDATDLNMAKRVVNQVVSAATKGKANASRAIAPSAYIKATP